MDVFTLNEYERITYRFISGTDLTVYKCFNSNDNHKN